MFVWVLMADLRCLGLTNGDEVVMGPHEWGGGGYGFSREGMRWLWVLTIGDEVVMGPHD